MAVICAECREKGVLDESFEIFGMGGRRRCRRHHGGRMR